MSNSFEDFFESFFGHPQKPYTLQHNRINPFGSKDAASKTDLPDLEKLIETAQRAARMREMDNKKSNKKGIPDSDFASAFREYSRSAKNNESWFHGVPEPVKHYTLSNNVVTIPQAVLENYKSNIYPGGVCYYYKNWGIYFRFVSKNGEAGVQLYCVANHSTRIKYDRFENQESLIAILDGLLKDDLKEYQEADKPFQYYSEPHDSGYSYSPPPDYSEPNDFVSSNFDRWSDEIKATNKAKVDDPTVIRFERWFQGIPPEIMHYEQIKLPVDVSVSFALINTPRESYQSFKEGMIVNYEEFSIYLKYSGNDLLLFGVADHRHRTLHATARK